MDRRTLISLFTAIIMICAGCDAQTAATPAFATAILPTAVPSATATITAEITQAAVSEVIIPTIIPIGGTTTSQLNIRAEPSTASDALGMIDIFTRVQIIGRDASGSWYQIIFTETMSGFIRAEYVKLDDAAAEIPVIETGAGSGSAGSGLVIQKINVRGGPATTFESYGVLSPNDVVLIAGRDSSGKWIQIKFANAPDGLGWVTSEFVQISNVEGLPVIGGEATQQAAPAATDVSATPASVFPAAMADGDSISAPLAVTLFSAAKVGTLQLTGEISAPGGDTKDWVKFSTDGGDVMISLACSNNSVQVELWSNEILTDTFLLSCGEQRNLNAVPGNWYILSLSASNTNEDQYINYILNLETIR